MTGRQWAHQGAFNHRAVLLAVMLVVLSSLAVPGAVAQDGPPPRVTDHPLLQPIDAQNHLDNEFKTWDDYEPVRSEAWNSPFESEGTVVQYRAAVVLIDYEDQPFLVTTERGSHPFGNPAPPGSPFASWDPVDPDDLQQWFTDYYNIPNEFNSGQTIHGYWMETSHGRVGVTVDVFGPYTMPGKQHEWGLGHGPTGGRNLSATGATSVCPAGDQCTGRNIRTDANLPWRTDRIAEGMTCPLSGGVADCGYNFLLYVTAAHDETSTWQEQGEMLFQTHLDVPDSFGPPGAEDGPVLNGAGNPIPNYVHTRYFGDAGISPEQGGFTSWRSGASQWPNATGGARPSSTQAESSGHGVFAHEISHLLGQPDNYNNPFANNQRSPTAYWEMMSRGSFNGPGGTHSRWQVPNEGGSALGPHHTMKYKRAMGFYSPGDIVEVQRDALEDSGVLVTRLQARAQQPGQGGASGLRVQFGATTANNQNLRTCAALGYTGADAFWCHGNNNYHNYEVEVVDTIGNDSFAPGHGVLIALTRNNNTFPSVWLIDPNPETLDLIDFYRPDGTPVPVLRGDPRQLNNATWHAGTNSGSEYEFVDDLNNLHFYILDTHRDDDGVLFYDIGARRLTGAGPFARGVAVAAATKTAREPGFLASCTFPVTNTGEAGAAPFDKDIFRVSATSSSGDWEVVLPNALAAAGAGETVDVPVQVLRTAENEDGDARTVVTLTATSESDGAQSASATCNVHVRDTTPAGSKG